MSYISFQPNDYFNTVLWTTDGTGNKALTTGHSTDMVWIKFRDYAYDHRIYDDVRGVTKKIIPNKTDAESTTTDLASFDTNGFTVGSNLNSSGEGGLVGWSWKANGSGSANSDGSDSSTVSANTTAGFSIVKWTPSGGNATVGHGLGAVPEMIISFRIDGAQDRFVYHKDIGNTKYVRLNQTTASTTDANAWNNTTPTSSVFSVGSQFGGSDYIAYCFAEKKGFSKFGSYVGNGSTDGSFIYTGFKPAFVMIKSTGTEGWYIIDNKRTGFNEANYALIAQDTSAEETGTNRINFLSNGFKATTSNSAVNTSGQTYIYMAFAEAPLVSSNGVPAVAR